MKAKISVCISKRFTSVLCDLVLHPFSFRTSSAPVRKLWFASGSSNTRSIWRWAPSCSSERELPKASGRWPNYSRRHSTSTNRDAHPPLSSVPVPFARALDTNLTPRRAAVLIREDSPFHVIVLSTCSAKAQMSLYQTMHCKMIFFLLFQYNHLNII